MANNYQWQFIRPLDQTAQIAALASGNQQINTGLQAMGTAVTGYADQVKKDQTNTILNALMQAQNTEQLPQAMQAVQALQEQYGRGYDQEAVRNAIDTRGSTLGQRELQAINLQQAHAAQNAIPIMNQAGAQFYGSRDGLSPEQKAAFQQLSELGIDTTTMMSGLSNTGIGDYRDNRDYQERITNRKEDVQYRNEQARLSQQNADREYEFKADNEDWKRGGDLYQPASSQVTTDAAGNLVTVQNSGVSRVDAYGALASVRGIRNNNPGNLNFAGQRGASRENGNGRFASFGSPEEGLAALGKQLDLHFTGKSAKAKEAGRPLQSVTDIIGAWAPPNENNTKAYVATVAKQLGVSPTAKLNLNDAKTKQALMQAIVKHENGGNPYSPEQYASALGGKVPTSASSAISSVGLSQSSVAKLQGDYGSAIAKLNAEYNNAGQTALNKGSLATTGKNLDTWAAGKKDSGLIFAGNKSFFTSASDLAKMAKADPGFNKLPQDAQMNILEGAYAKMNDVNFAQYVPDGDLKKFISNESQQYNKDRVAQFNQKKEATFESSYQQLVTQFRGVGSNPPSREAARQLLDPTYKPKKSDPPAVKAVAAVNKQVQTKEVAAQKAVAKADNAVKAVEAVQAKVAAPKANTPPKYTAEELALVKANPMNLSNADKAKRLDLLRADAYKTAVDKKSAEAARVKAIEDERKLRLANARAEVAKKDAARKAREAEAAKVRAEKARAKAIQDLQVKSKQGTEDWTKNLKKYSIQ